MVDRVYWCDLSHLRKALLELRSELSQINLTTDWTALGSTCYFATWSRSEARCGRWNPPACVEECRHFTPT